MADFVGRNIDTSLGDTGLGESNSVQDKIARMLNLSTTSVSDTKKADQNLEPIKNLDNIDVVVGKAVEQDIQRDLLDFAPEEWNCFPTATNDTILKMATSIYSFGLLHRVTVWQMDNGRYMILGGHTRTTCYDYLYEATKDDKYKTVPCLVYEHNQLSEDDAHRIFIVSNTDQRSLSVKTTTLAYCDLMKLEKKKAFYGSGIYSRDAAAKQANTTPTTFSRYLKLKDLDDKLMDEVDSGTLTVKNAYELSFLSKDLQQLVYDSGAYVSLSSSTAKKLRGAESKEDIKRIVDETKTVEEQYRYSVVTTVKKPQGREILPIYIDTKDKDIIMAQLRDAISSSSMDEKYKQEILLTL